MIGATLNTTEKSQRHDWNNAQDLARGLPSGYFSIIEKKYREFKKKIKELKVQLSKLEEISDKIF